MLHIKDIEAFARINEALAHRPPTRPIHPAASAPARSDEDDFEEADAAASVDAIPLATAEVVPFPRRKARLPQHHGADTIGGVAFDFDFVPKRAVNVAGLFSRFFLNRR